MSALGAGWPLAAALSLAAPASAGTLSVEAAGGTLVEVSVPDGGEWCLRWNHSVTGGRVADCFVNDDGRMILERSYLHDFAAGLGEVQGRGGTLRSAEGGGYWIEGIDERIANDTLPLRVGRPSVDHRLEVGGREYGLSDLAAGERVILRLTP